MLSQSSTEPAFSSDHRDYEYFELELTISFFFFEKQKFGGRWNLRMAKPTVSPPPWDKHRSINLLDIIHWVLEKLRCKAITSLENLERTCFICSAHLIINNSGIAFLFMSKLTMRVKLRTVGILGRSGLSHHGVLSFKPFPILWFRPSLIGKGSWPAEVTFFFLF